MLIRYRNEKIISFIPEFMNVDDLNKIVGSRVKTAWNLNKPINITSIDLLCNKC